MKLTTTLLVSMMALSLSVSISHAKPSHLISTPANNVANLPEFGDEVQANSGLDAQAKTGERMNIQSPSSPTLDALETKPNTLHGIDGLHQGRVPLGAVSPNTLKTFVSVVDLVRRDYVEEVSDETLFKNAMNGMLKGLDSHAEFLDKDAFANLQSFTAGNVANIGLSAMWQAKDNHWVITDVQEDSFIRRAGVKVGDYLHQVGRLNWMTVIAKMMSSSC
ncbi:S41 family peptidase [Moraxella nonliquefaciens]|uniref:S41 family peptidase n=1 Tax=Moraxella nonliquefaciens TaxID=478 RepID=UPI003EE391F5